MPPALATETGDAIRVANETASAETLAADHPVLNTGRAGALGDDVFQQATQEGNLAIRLDPAISIQQGQRRYTNSSW